METRFTRKMSYNVDDMRSLYKELFSGHWFDADTMRFFKSRILSDFKRLDDKSALFMSSEKRPDGFRGYTVRKATLKVIDDEGRMKMDIGTVGPFCELSKYEAKKLMATYEQD